MKPSLLALAFVCGAALAGEADPSSQAAPAGGGTDTQQSGYAQSPSAALPSPKTRAQVRAEYLADREEARALTGEDSGSAYLAGTANARPDREYMARANPRLRNR